MDKELLYNQSGIKDETAYRAITNINGGNANMNGTDINKGEIWEVENGTGTKYVVVLGCFERYAATIMLQEQEPGSNAVRVRAHGIMYADAGRLGWTFYDKVVAFIRALTDDEEAELRRAIGAALDLEVNKVSAATTAMALEKRDKAYEAAQQYENMAAAATADLEAAQKEADYLREELAKAKEVIQKQAEIAAYTELPPCISVEDIAENNSLREDLAAARREAEIYKGLYENMLARALG